MVSGFGIEKGRDISCTILEMMRFETDPLNLKFCSVLKLELDKVARELGKEGFDLGES